jgi:diaminopimelate epimerase
MVAGLPEFDVAAVERVTADAPPELVAGEQRLGYAVVGVPHVVVAVADPLAVDLVGRGRGLRLHPWTGAPGANVNFVGPDARGGWVMRTYERGVEGETLACGTGAVASAVLLVAWGHALAGGVRIWTRSGEPLDVAVRQEGEGWHAALRGEGRLVFRGELVDR